MKELGYGAEYRYTHDEPNLMPQEKNYFHRNWKIPSIIFQLIEEWKFKLKKNLNVYKSKIKRIKNAINRTTF